MSCVNHYMMLIPTQYTSPSCTNLCLIHPKKLISNAVRPDHCPFPLQHLHMTRERVVTLILTMDLGWSVQWD